MGIGMVDWLKQWLETDNTKNGFFIDDIPNVHIDRDNGDISGKSVYFSPTALLQRHSDCFRKAP